MLRHCKVVCAFRASGKLLCSLSLIPIVLMIPACGAFKPPPPECGGGICPPPDPGVYVNTIGLNKAIWLEDDRIGRWSTFSDGIRQTLCERNFLAGDELEIIVYGKEGFFIAQPAPGKPAASTFIPVTPPFPPGDHVPGRSQAIDVDSDGNAEFLNVSELPTTLSLVSSAGSEVWSMQLVAPVESSSLWRVIDIDGDGTGELVGISAVGLILVDARTGEQATLGNEHYDFFRAGQLDDDNVADFVLFVDSEEFLQRRLEIWSLAKGHVASIRQDRPDVAAAGPLSLFEVSSFPHIDNSLEFITVGCAVFSVDGEIIQSFPLEFGTGCDFQPSAAEAVETRVDLGTCDLVSEITQITPFEVAFRADEAPYTVKMAHSFEQQYAPVGVIPFLPPVYGPVSYRVLRIILSVYDQEETLVYEEVLETSTGPNSFAVIPSFKPGSQALLLADDDRVLVYRLTN